MARGKRRRRLEDGQLQRIHSQSAWPRVLEVVAYRQDSDSPHVYLTLPGDTTAIVTLTDTDARQLIEDLQEALYILPTSK